jgi:hemoglobin
MSDAAAELDRPTPFAMIGGEAGVQRLVARFYDLMDQDSSYAALRAMHAPDLAPMRKSLAGFLTGWLGGPRDWFDARGGFCIMSAHGKLAIGQAEAAEWTAAMSRAIDDTGVPPELAAKMRQAFANLGEGMVNR